MLEQCRVLVTGAGSGVGQGIIKALRISDLPVTIVASDICHMNAGLYRADEAIIIPQVESPGALDMVVELLKKYHINVVMIGSEFDLTFLSINKKKIESRTNAIVIVAPPKTIEIANDKWLTAKFLKANNLPYAKAHSPKDLEDAISISKSWGYPIVLNARQGTSSRHVHIVENSLQLKNLYHVTPMPMLQRLIDIPTSEIKNEYTCSIFKKLDGRFVGPFTARRTLRGGTSWNIEVSDFEHLKESLIAIASAFDCPGSLNVQLMLTDDGPIPFELNARFSGTTAVRAHFGFNEPEMALLSYFYKKSITNPKISSGVALRYNEEVFVENESAFSLSCSLHKGVVNQWF